MEYGITEYDAEKQVEIYEKRGRVTVRVRERTYHIPQKYYAVELSDGERWQEVYAFASEEEALALRVRKRTYHIPQKYYAVELSDGDGDHWGQVYRFATEEEAVAARDRLAYFIDKEART